MDNKIIFPNGTEFTEAGYPAVGEPPLVIGKRFAGRPYLRVTVNGTVDAVKTAFVDDAEPVRHIYTQRYAEVTDPETGDVTSEPVEGVFDDTPQTLSGYPIAGDVVDHRDGTVTAYMLGATVEERLQDAISALETLGYTEGSAE